MTIGGALSELNNLLNADDIPIYYKPSIKAVMDTISLSNSEKPNKWIPVSDELPEKAVLCCDRYGEMLVAYPFKDEECNTGYAASMDDYCMIDCVAWMPLPKPYKAEGSENEK